MNDVCFDPSYPRQIFLTRFKKVLPYLNQEEKDDIEETLIESSLRKAKKYNPDCGASLETYLYKNIIQYAGREISKIIKRRNIEVYSFDEIEEYLSKRTIDRRKINEDSIFIRINRKLLLEHLKKILNDIDYMLFTRNILEGEDIIEIVQALNNNGFLYRNKKPFTYFTVFFRIKEIKRRLSFDTKIQDYLF